MMFIGILIVGLIIVAGLPATRTKSCSGQGKSGGSYAILILQERYARGEIDREEFLHMKKTLRTFS